MISEIQIQIIINFGTAKLINSNLKDYYNNKNDNPKIHIY